jgi:phosphoribosylformylglycinamidine (FGAM) synthase-like enzyme
MLVAVAEMLIAGSTKDNPIGASLTLHDGESETCELFGEAPSRYVIEIDDDDDTLDAISELVFGFEDVGFSTIGKLDDSGELSVLTSSGNRAAWNVEDLAKAWLSPLDW